MENIEEEFITKVFCCMHLNCTKEYQSKYNLLRHIDINHLKKRTGKCGICGKEFIDYENLKEHSNIHTNSKPYTYDVCGKSFRNKCMLTRHIRDHRFSIFNVNSES